MGTVPFLAPVTYVNKYYGGIFPDGIEEDSFDASLVQSIGAIVIGFAIHVFLALSSVSSGTIGVSLEEAMGYALLPRIVLILWSLIRARFRENKGEYQFEGTSFLKVNFLAMSWSAYSLLTKAGNPSLSAKLFSIMALGKAMALILKPVKMTEKIFGVNVSGEGMYNTEYCVSLVSTYYPRYFL